MADVLPYGQHCIDEDDIAAVAAVLRGGMLTGGPTVTAFEEALAARLDVPHAVSNANGTAALHLAMLALGVGPGDRVVVPALTFLATANAARYVDADVVFADVDPDTGLLTADTFAAAVERAGGPVRAVIPVHLNGQSADMVALSALARTHGVAVVEDACHAIGATQAIDAAGATAPVGACALSDMACFSFHPVKTIAAGEGGAVTTRDAVLAERLARLRNHGMVRAAEAFQQPDLALDAAGQPNPWYYEMPEPGFNYRLSDIHCALALSQLGKLDGFVARRSALRARYADRLAGHPLIRLAPAVEGGTAAWHLCVIQVDWAGAGLDRAALMHRLRARGVGTQVHYLPVAHQPYYRALYGAAHLPGADAYYARCLSLPLYPAMGEADVDRVVDALEEVVPR